MKLFFELIIESIVTQTVYGYCPKKCLYRQDLSLYCLYQNMVNEDLKLIFNTMSNNIKNLSLTGNLLDENSIQLIKNSRTWNICIRRQITFSRFHKIFQFYFQI